MLQVSYTDTGALYILENTAIYENMSRSHFTPRIKRKMNDILINNKVPKMTSLISCILYHYNVTTIKHTLSSKLLNKINNNNNNNVYLFVWSSNNKYLYLCVFIDFGLKCNINNVSES